MAFARFVERRQHERNTVSIPGRLLLEHRREGACTIVNASAGGIAVLSRERGVIGEAVVVYVDGVGRLQGEIVRLIEGGFAVKLTGSSRGAELLAKRFAFA